MSNKIVTGLKSKDKPDAAYRDIKELLFIRKLNPGQKISYNDLCELLGISKTPIITALNRLVYEGFVLYEKNRGYRIAPINENFVPYLFEIRLVLECLNVRNAIKNFDQQAFAKLKAKNEILTNYRPEYTDRKKMELDMDLHMELAKMGGNKLSRTFLKPVLEHIHFVYRLERGIDKRKKEIEYEHGMVIESIGNRNIEMAEKYMQDHIEALQELMLDYLKELKKSNQDYWI